MNVSYDSTDRQILGLLQDDASEAVGRIAASVGLSTNACWRRIRRLESAGFIRKRVAILDPAMLGLTTTVFMSIRAKEHSEAWIEHFSAVLGVFPEVLEFYRLSGGTDYLVKILVRDIAAYDLVYKRLIAAVDLSSVSSAFVIQELKQTTALPISPPDNQ